MFALMGRFPLTDDEHRDFISMLLGRPDANPVKTRKELTPGEVRIVVAGYEGYLLMAHVMRDVRHSGRRFDDPTQEDDDADPGDSGPPAADEDRR